MRKCHNKQCEEIIPKKIIIDGKERSLQHRKYCLKCSPFGFHNTKPFGYVRMSPDGRNCPVCNKKYFRKGILCNSCKSNLRRFEVKERCIKYLGGKCSKCGYNKCVAALVFHHKNPKEKEFGIGSNHCLSFQKLKTELDKCILLCHNCHSELHWEENGELRKLIIQKHKEIKSSTSR